MERYIRWYMLLVKAWTKRKTSWVMTIGLLLVILLVSGIHFPTTENTTVGICIPNEKYAKEVLSVLEQRDSTFVFKEYEDPDELQNAILSGSLECGFIFEDGFQECVEKGRLNEIITYVCTPMTVKGEVAKETVYTAFLQVYGKEILIDNEETVFGKNDENITQTLLEKYEGNQENSRLLELKTEVIESRNGGTEIERSSSVYVVQGVAGILIFLMLWFECGRKFQKSEDSVCLALDGGQKNIFRFCSYLAAALVPSAAAFFMIMITGKSRGILTEVLAMILFVFLCCLWVLVFGKLFKRSTAFVSWALTLVLIQALICPVFMDLAEYFPAVGYIRYIFPLAWYLVI